HRPPALSLADHPHSTLLKTVAEDALTRLLLPALEREIRRELTERAQEHAVAVFARNLRSLLLQPPLRNTRVLAIDPGFPTGCRQRSPTKQARLQRRRQFTRTSRRTGKTRRNTGWRSC